MSRTTVPRHLTLLLPGLFNGAVDKRYRALETILARADLGHIQQEGYHARLFSLFGIAASQESDLPVAALSLRAGGSIAEGGTWLCADPVHFIADQSQVYLTNPLQLPISEEEAESLIAELNRFYADEGWQFVMTGPHRWYLHLPQHQSIRTVPLRQAIGHAIGPMLPQGEGQVHWHRLMNELQMLLHGSRVNLEREAVGKQTINGIWLWGGGALPAASDSLPWRHVWAGNDLTRGLAQLHKIPVYGLPGSFAAMEKRFGSSRTSSLSQSDELLVFDVLDEAGLTPEAHAEWLERLEGTWFAPLLVALQRGDIRKLTIDAADGRYWTLDTKMVKRWWRRRRPLPDYFRQQ